LHAGIIILKVSGDKVPIVDHALFALIKLYYVFQEIDAFVIRLFRRRTLLYLGLLLFKAELKNVVDYGNQVFGDFFVDIVVMLELNDLV
tara:strand:+ start:231 stop:497 length:267 start_codon:yes stop_codon:yes gene_type:complete